MSIVNTFSLESNRKIKINFNGGDLSSDAGLLLIKEFVSKIGLTKLVKSLFKTTDSATVRHHTDPDNLMQFIYQLIASYFEDDCSDELTNDPIMTEIESAAVEEETPVFSTGWTKIRSLSLIR